MSVSVLLVVPIWTLQFYVCSLEQVKLYVSSNIPLVAIGAYRHNKSADVPGIVYRCHSEPAPQALATMQTNTADFSVAAAPSEITIPLPI